MATSLLAIEPAIFAEIQQWLQEKGWRLEPPCTEWNYWHIELGEGKILPVTQTVLLQLYRKNRPSQPTLSF